MANVFAARPFTDEEERALGGADPQPVHAAMTSCPVHRGADGTLMLTRMEDVADVTRRRDVLGPGAQGPMMGGKRPLIPLDLDGPEHLKYRRLLDPLFSARSVAPMEPRVRALADALIDGFLPHLEAGASVDLHREYSQPLPSIFFLELLGIPRADLDQFLSWKNALLGHLPPGLTMPERMAAVRAAGERCYAYFGALFDERARAGDAGDDLIGRLMTAELDGERLGRDQLLDIAYLMVLAGLDTVTSALSCMIAHLARAPGLRRRLVSEPALWPAAVEELLRYESPVATGFRFPAEEITIGGERIAAGTPLFVSWAAANLDSAAFPDPLGVDLDRRGPAHVAFGSGYHRCLGMALARMELRAALDQLHRRLPDYALAPGHELRFTGKPRTPDGLPLIRG